MTDGNNIPVELNENNQSPVERTPDTTPTEKHPPFEPPCKQKRPLSWQIVRIIGFFFLGWSGLQLVFLPNLAFIVLNNESLTTLISSLFSENTGFLPLMIFLISTYLLIMFLIHLLTEMEYRSRLNHYVIPWSDVPTVFVNYGLPLLVQFLFVILLQVTVLGVLFFGYRLLASFIPLHIDMFDLTYRIAIISITFPWIIMQFMLDTTLERGVKGRSFSYCYRRARYLFAHKTGDIFRYLLVRLTLIMLSLICFKLFILSLILPLKIYVFYTWNWNTNIIFGNLLTTTHVLINAGKLMVGMIITGFLFSPIATPLYWLNTRLIRNYLYRSGQL
jgi:hypothetical protein